jgi:uncharacterized protein
MMSSSTHDHVQKVTDLLDRPGESRQVDLVLPVPEGFEHPLAAFHDPLRLHGVIESVVDGLLVRATLETTVEVACSRCLEPVTDAVRTDVIELFHDPARLDPDELAEVDEGYAIAEGTIDLDALLRDSLAPALPAQPRCRDDCAGLCPSCGVNRNENTCGCRDEHDDPRWAALRGLRLPAGEDDTHDQTTDR